MIAPLPTDPAQLRALAAAHEDVARVLRKLADDLSPAPIATTPCPVPYEFRGDGVPPVPLTAAEQAERDLARYREQRKNAERESRKC